MKVICAGMSRTGTKSLAEALRILGYTNVHDVFEHFSCAGEYWKKIFEGRGTVEDFKKMYADVDAVSDIPACIFWEEILEAFPDAKVILTIREEDKWVESFTSHLRMVGENSFLVRHPWLGRFIHSFTPTGVQYVQHATHACIVSYGYFPTWNYSNEFYLRHNFRKHNRNVINGCPKEKLLVFRVKEGWEPLCKFLQKEIPPVPFPHANKISDSIILKFSNGTYKYGGELLRKIKSELIMNLMFAGSALVLVTSLLMIL